MFRIRVLQAFVLAAAVGALGACAGAQPRSAKAPAPQPAVAKHGDAKAYRFNMTQRGKKMSAEDFDAWMKANGLHVAQGKAKPAAKPAAKTGTRTAAKAKPKTTAAPEKVASATTTATTKK